MQTHCVCQTTGIKYYFPRAVISDIRMLELAKQRFEQFKKDFKRPFILGRLFGGETVWKKVRSALDVIMYAQMCNIGEDEIRAVYQGDYEALQVSLVEEYELYLPKVNMFDTLETNMEKIAEILRYAQCETRASFGS